MNYKNPNSVLVVIYAKNTQRVLMLQRQDDPNFWQSVTGTIETGEKPIKTAQREVLEETGLQISEQNSPLVDCNHQVEFEIFPQFRYKYAPDVNRCTEHWFLLGVDDEFTPTLTEHLAFQWLTVEDAIKLTKSPNNATAIEQYLRR